MKFRPVVQEEMSFKKKFKDKERGKTDDRQTLDEDLSQYHTLIFRLRLTKKLSNRNRKSLLPLIKIKYAGDKNIHKRTTTLEWSEKIHGRA